MKFYLAKLTMLFFIMHALLACDNKASTDAQDQPLLLVANKHSNTLSFIHPETHEVVETIPTGPNPHEITVTPDQRYAYLSSYIPPGNTISVVDLVNRKLVKEIH